VFRDHIAHSKDLCNPIIDDDRDEMIPLISIQDTFKVVCSVVLLPRFILILFINLRSFYVFLKVFSDVSFLFTLKKFIRVVSHVNFRKRMNILSYIRIGIRIF